MYFETLEERQYRLKAWFAYRYLFQNPSKCENKRVKALYVAMDKYFMEKYKLDTEEQTRQGILQLFNFESEKPIIMNDTVVENLINDFEAAPQLWDCVEN